MVPTGVHRAIEALNHEFAYRVDFGPSETVAELFTADGWYGWDSRRSAGREEIRESYRLRASRGTRTARHGGSSPTCSRTRSAHRCCRSPSPKRELIKGSE